MYVKNEGKKTINAKSLKGHWYTLKCGALVEVENEDIAHLVKREGVVKHEPAKEVVKKLEEKKKEKVVLAGKADEELKEEMEKARGKIKVANKK